MLRTHTNGELTAKDIGKEVKLAGWVHTRRDHGGVVFVDFRDRYGFTQIVFNPDNKAISEAADKLRREDCITVSGKVRLRPSGMENKKIKTGEIEVIVSELEMINKAETPPLEVDDRIIANDDVRLKYRYLDLRRPVMQQHLIFRHQVAQLVREYMSANDFIEIETPFLIASTPEGARDYVVPSRVNPGKFYALPQSPQLYKQMLMVSGMDRYFQLARCLRDEDLRADRQPEHTQIDLEMSFVEQKDILAMIEGLMKHIFKKQMNVTLDKFPVITYDESMDSYGCDKPDMRFGLKLHDVTSIVTKSDFGVFKDVSSSGGIVKCIIPEKDLGRKEIDAYIAFCQENGAKGMAWMRVTANGLESNIAKYFPEAVQKELIKATGAKPGSIAMFIADKKDKCNEILAKLRNKLGADLGMIKPGEFKFCWVVDFPMFEWNAEDEKWDFKHNPFAMPKKDHLSFMEKSPEKVYADLYDLVLNGSEMSSGAIRITQPEIQERVFNIVGMDMETARKRFGFMLEAYKYGGPIHGGMGIGFDRLVATMMGIADIREVIAFPKNKAAECPMDGCPSEITEKQLKELKLKLDIASKPPKQ